MQYFVVTIGLQRFLISVDRPSVVYNEAGFSFFLILLLSTLVIAASFNKRIPKCYKNARIIQYWILKEGEVDMTNDGSKVTLDGSKTES